MNGNLTLARIQIIYSEGPGNRPDLVGKTRYHLLLWFCEQISPFDANLDHSTRDMTGPFRATFTSGNLGNALKFVGWDKIANQMVMTFSELESTIEKFISETNHSGFDVLVSISFVPEIKEARDLFALKKGRTLNSTVQKPDDNAVRGGYVEYNVQTRNSTIPGFVRQSYIPV